MNIRTAGLLNGIIGLTVSAIMIGVVVAVYTVKSRTDELIEQADEVIADSNENKKQDSVTVLINGEWKSINFKNHTITDALPPDTQEEASSVEVLNHNYEADKFSPPPYKSYEDYVTHLKGMNFPDSLIDTREEYINKYPEHMTYDEYVQAMMKFNLRVRSKEEFEKMFNKKLEPEIEVVESDELWHMSYEEYVELMIKNNQRVGTREEFEKLFEPAQETK